MTRGSFGSRQSEGGAFEAASLSAESREMVEKCRGIVRAIAWRVHRRAGRRVEIEDLIQIGSLALVQAAQRFDSSRGAQFSTFAWEAVRGAIMDGLKKQHAWFSPHDYYRGNYNELAEDHLELSARDEARHGRGDPDEERRWAGRVAARLAVARIAIERAYSGDARDPSDVLVEAEVRRRLWDCVDSLSPVDRDLVHMRFGEGLTLEEAGARMNVSRSWAQRKEAAAIDRLAELLRRRASA